MIEVLWHGRGGQGAFTAARLLGAAASLADGRHALAFPSFGPERRGAPMRAFTKMDERPIGDRSAIAHADYVVYLDETLLGDEWADELKPGGRVLVNSARGFKDERIVAIDADGISSAILGRPIPNTVFLGALSALCDQVDVKDVKEAVRQYMPKKLHEGNVRIVDAAREATAAAARPCEEDNGVSVAADGDMALSASAPAFGAFAPEFGAGTGASASPTASGPDAPVSAPASDASAVLAASGTFASPARPDARIPSLRDETLDPAAFAHTTCFEAGYLAAKNAGWRNVRPVIDATACTGCLQCYLYCPDGTVYKVPAACQPPEPADAADGCSTRSSRDPDMPCLGFADQGAPARAHSMGLNSPLDCSMRTEVRGASAIPRISGTAAVLADVSGPAARTQSAATQPTTAPVAIDYDFCKGCGVCAKACRFGAITMVPERGESEEDAR